MHTTVWLAYSSLLVVVSLGARVLVATAFSGSLWAGYALSATSNMAHPDHGLLLSNLVGQTVLATFFGHLLYLVLADLYITRDRLRVLTEGLQDRIDVATEELRALTERLDSVRSEERRWMAHAIHDELGQELTAMRFTLALAQDQVTASDAGASATLDDLEQLLERTGKTMRRIITRLRPVVLDELGFAGALAWLARDQGGRMGCDIRVRIAPTASEPGSNVAEMMFRAAQEGLTNVAKHAGATRVEISVDAHDGRAVMVIDDDGQGLDASGETAGDGPSGIGMIGIRERARALDGSARWSASPHGGTRLEVVAPLGAGEAA